MGGRIAIHKLAAQIGVTSRTLRHWESEGLFESTRNPDSTWRTYDTDAVLCVRITALLRQYDVPIKEIETVVKSKTFKSMFIAINAKLSALTETQKNNTIHETRLKQLLLLCQEQGLQTITQNNFAEITNQLTEIFDKEQKMEEFTLTSPNTNNSNLRIISLAPMRVVYYIAVSTSPEGEAMKPVIDWLKSVHLEGTARLYGGNMDPMPCENGKPYGYGMCASIPAGIAVPDHLKEMTLPGGLYAVYESSDNIEESWKIMMKELSKSSKYQSDRSRLCLEEHIRNDKPDGCGDEYFLNLLEPVKCKTC